MLGQVHRTHAPLTQELGDAIVPDKLAQHDTCDPSSGRIAPGVSRLSGGYSSSSPLTTACPLRVSRPRGVFSAILDRRSFSAFVPWSPSVSVDELPFQRSLSISD